MESASVPLSSFHALAEGLKKNSAHPPFALQIGAMDGIKFDLLHQHFIQGGWHGLLVEPLPDMFAALRETYRSYPSLQLANCAVAEHDGTLELKRIRPEAVAEGVVPEQALGISTGLTTGGALNNPNIYHDFPQLTERHMARISVPCLSLKSLLDQYQVERIDLMVIDTEGADWIIARQLDPQRYAPHVICLEHTGLSDADKIACLQHYLAHGYTASLCEEDRENFLFMKQAA